MASGYHRKWVLGREDARLAAVCDTTEVRRKTAADDSPGIAVYESYEQFLADAAVELVVVTTPPSSHCDLAVAACRSGKHVFVDKPFAMTLAQAELMLDAAADAGVAIHCNQSRRYDGEYQAILEVVRSGRIGTIVHLRRIWSQTGEGWATWGIEGFNPTWRIQRDYGGGMVYDYAPHCGDQILRLVDKPLTHVYADARGVKFSDEVDDHFTCTMRFAGGATAFLEASNLAAIPASHWYVEGTEGCIRADAVNGSVTVVAEGSDGPETIEPIQRIHELHENVVATCIGGAEPVVTAADLRASMGLIDAIFESSRTGALVTLAS